MYDRVGNVDISLQSKTLLAYNNNAISGLSRLGYEVEIIKLPKKCPDWYFGNNQECQREGCSYIHGDYYRAILRNRESNQVFSFSFWGTPGLNTEIPYFTLVHLMYQINQHIRNDRLNIETLLGSVGLANNTHGRSVARSLIIFKKAITKCFSASAVYLQNLATGRAI